MKSLQDRPIRQKINAVIMLVAGAVLVVACVALLIFQAWTIKRKFVSELGVIGQMVASNVAVAAMFKDEEKALQVLEGLKAMPQIVCARLDLKDGTRLAHFGKAEEANKANPLPLVSGLRVEGSRVLLSQPVMREGQQHGTLVLQADFHDSYVELLELYGSILTVVLLASLLLTYILSGQFQHWVTAPILRLADTAHKIAEGKDYSVRAAKAGSDEVGTLTDAFNQMLSQIHAQDNDLQRAQLKLHEQLSALELEVAERKAAEEALRESQEKLLQTSRLAGMAEVATSVLHNVGNVLNSVNVAGNCINERLRGSKITALAKISDLIDEHRADFSEFVANDQRGKRIPDLVSAVNAAMGEEHKALLTEVDSITQHIGHIKEIVAMQQSYARVGGVIEQMEVEDLVDDALRMNSVSLTRHHVEVTHEYEPVPKVQVDRHKVLQILVNLLSNAKHAVDDSGREDKKVVMRIRNNGGQYVKISVEDNGIGIPPENINRIFAHGFTTKKSGHGFGLHSGALAAAEIGGALRVHSKGVGQGATFTLELPIIAPSRVEPANKIQDPRYYEI